MEIAVAAEPAAVIDAAVLDISVAPRLEAEQEMETSMSWKRGHCERSRAMLEQTCRSAKALLRGEATAVIPSSLKALPPPNYL